MTYRVIIKSEFREYFIGKTFNDKRYKILKNQYSKKFKVGSDFCFYAREEKGFFSNTLIPISDEEAGVKTI